MTTSVVFVIHPVDLYADSIATALSAHDINVVGYSSRPDQRTLNANLFVVDCDAPTIPLPRLVKRLRNCSADIKVVGLSKKGLTPEQISRANLDSVVSKSEHVVNLCERLGKKGIAPRPVIPEERPQSIFEMLTPREVQVYLGVVSGKTNVDIAGDLKIGASTVGEYKRRILGKLDLESDLELILKAKRSNNFLDGL